MDSTREPSSSSPVTPSQSQPEEDAILSAASGMAKEAALLFQSHRYQECVDVLNQIFLKKEDDPKVVHNIAVAEYYGDGCSDPKKLLEVLNKVKKRSEDLARACGEQTEAISNSGSKGSMNNASHQSSNSNSIEFLYADDFDTSITTLNIGVVLYNLQEYARALSVLEPLYQNIEPIEETTALHICLLILDIALACHDASKAAGVIHYLEKTFGVGSMTSQGENGSTQSCQPSPQAAKTAPVPTNLVSVDVSNLDSGVGANASESSSLVRTLSDETEYENLFSSLDIGGQTLSKSTASNDMGRSTERSSVLTDLKLKLNLYKVRLLLLTRNLKATKREVKSAMNMARGRDSSTALLLKSQLEYARGNHRKAIKLLMTSINRTEPGSSSIFFNNLGCIYHQLRKHSTSIFFFSKALESSLSVRSERPLKVSSQDKSFHIVYNCGLQYLICGKPVVAAQCFRKASPMFYNQPLLWLRLAECSLLALEKGLLKSDGISVNGEEVNVHIVGDGRWRQLIVEDASASSRNLDSLKEVDLSSDGQCKLSLPFARQCLLNALHLLNNLDSALMKTTAAPGSGEEESSQGISAALKNSNMRISADPKTSNMVATAAAGANGDSKESKGSASSYVTIQNSVSAYDNLRRKEYLMIKQAVLADLAFVELSLENPLKSLAAARALLELPDCSAIYAFLGNMYAAESLCRLNRLKEAAEHLFAYVSEGIDVRLPFNDEDSKRWINEKDVDVEEPSNVGASKSIAGPGNSNTDESILFMSAEEARGALFVNLAAMSAMQGSLEQAHKFALLAVAAIPSNPSAVLSAVYVDLLLGKAQDAIARLKQCRHLRFLSPGVTLSRPRS